MTSVRANLPGSARLHDYVRNDLRFEVLDTGPLDGPVALLLHGFPERASHWAEVSRHLNAAGVRTLAPDQRGYSPAARPRTRWSYRMSELVADVVALIDEIGRPVHLVGHDWGAAVAWRTAAEHEDRIVTLTTVSVPHPSAFGRSLLSSSQLLRSWYVLVSQPPGLVEALAMASPRALAGMLRITGLDETAVNRFDEEIVHSGALPGALGWYRALPFDLGTTRRIRVPTTHVWSDGDVALSSRGAELTGRFVDAPYELVVLEGVSHWVPTQAPESLADVVLRRIRALV